MVQVIAWNYLTAILLCYSFFQPTVFAANSHSPWSIYLSLAILLPSVFLILVASIRHMGIVKTDAAQRLSLFIPLIAAWLLFGEQFNKLKIAGLLIGLPALVLILYKKRDNSANKWIYPAAVLFGYGAIDILFKKLAVYTSLPYTTSLFIIFSLALILVLIVILYRLKIRKQQLHLPSLLCGVLVGVFNFGNILFYLKAHRSFVESPSTVFAGMNMGVIIVGSLTGVLFFKEKLSRINYAGLLFALLAIVFITLSQLRHT